MIELRWWSYLRVLFCDNLKELLEVDATVTILICVFDHLLDLSSRETFSNALTNFSELLNTKGTLIVFVKDFEQLLKAWLWLAVSVEAEDLEKTLEIHLDIRWLSLHDVQDLSCLFLKAQCLDGGCQLLNRDIATLIVIENIETFLETRDVIRRQILRDVDGGIECWRLFGKWWDLIDERGTDRSGDLEDI